MTIARDSSHKGVTRRPGRVWSLGVWELEVWFVGLGWVHACKAENNGREDPDTRLETKLLHEGWAGGWHFVFVLVSI
jgi:hypothetical protein